jgi:hypothetical protein
MCEKSEAQKEDDHGSAVAADITVLKKLAEHEINYRKQIREQLTTSLSEHIDDNREQVLEDVSSNMEETLERQLKQFNQVERELVIILSTIFSQRYEGILNKWKQRNAQLFLHLKLIKEQAFFVSSRSGDIAFREMLADVLLTLLAAIIPFYYELLLPGQQSPLLRYIIPTLYVILIGILLVLKILFRRWRATEERNLRQAVENEYREAEPLDPFFEDASSREPRGAMSQDIARESPPQKSNSV